MKISSISNLDKMAREGEEILYNKCPQLIFGLGTCGIAAGGLPLKKFAEGYIDEKSINADIISVGCIGMCHAEPLVDVKLPGKPRVTYSEVDLEKLKRIIDEHLIGGIPVLGLAMCQLTKEMSECEYGIIDEPDLYDDIPTYEELPFFSKQHRIVLRNCGIVNPEEITEYVARGGYRSAFKALHGRAGIKWVNDILIDGAKLPEVSAGDIIAVPACGAYCLSMASNYNLSLRPAVVLVKDGEARLIRRRETYEDLMRCDVVSGEESYVAGGGAG